jgi:hypothetical protein
MVRQGEFCLAQGRRVLLPKQGIVSDLNGRPTPMGSAFLLMGGGGHGRNQLLNWAWTITPAKIPTGTRFVISAVPGDRVSATHIQAAWEFIPASAPVTCAESVKPS